MFDKLIKFSIKNKFFIGLMTLLLIIWGIWSASRIPIDAQPDITNNQVQIITLCPTLAGQEVEQLVTFPVEQSIVNLPGVEEIRSISRFGLSVVTVVFADDVDIYFARQLIHQQMNEVVEEIPEGVGRPELAPVSTGLGEVYQYILHPKKGSENKYSAMDLGLVILMAFILMALVALPCADAAEVNPVRMAHSEKTQDQSENTHSGSHSDHCSPLCLCDCCGISVMVFRLSFVECKNPLKRPARQKIRINDAYFESNFLATIWQPPK